MADFFKRIKNGEPLDTEELRSDLCQTTVNGFSYYGMALDGTSEDVEEWAIVKASYDGSGGLAREQLFLSVAWSQRRNL